MGGTKAPEDLLRKIRQGNRFLLTSHVNPDGDAIGSELGLARLLRRLGKGAVVWNLDPIPAIYRRLPRNGPNAPERAAQKSAFERRLLDEEAHYIYTFQWHRIVVHSARVRGWTITPSHFLNNQLDTVWLSE